MAARQLQQTRFTLAFEFVADVLGKQVDRLTDDLRMQERDPARRECLAGGLKVGLQRLGQLDIRADLAGVKVQLVPQPRRRRRRPRGELSRISIMDEPQPQSLSHSDDLVRLLQPVSRVGVRTRPERGVQRLSKPVLDHIQQPTQRQRGRGASRDIHNRNTIGDHRHNPARKSPFQWPQEGSFPWPEIALSNRSESPSVSRPSIKWTAEKPDSTSLFHAQQMTGPGKERRRATRHTKPTTGGSASLWTAAPDTVIP